MVCQGEKRFNDLLTTEEESRDFDFDFEQLAESAKFAEMGRRAKGNVRLHVYLPHKTDVALGMFQLDGCESLACLRRMIGTPSLCDDRREKCIAVDFVDKVYVYISRHGANLAIRRSVGTGFSRKALGQVGGELGDCHPKVRAGVATA